MRTVPARRQPGQFEGSEGGASVRYGTWQLPNDIDTSGAEAKFDRGVLTVKFPKVELEEEGPKRIELG